MNKNRIIVVNLHCNNRLVVREGGRHRKIVTRRVKLVRMETALSYIASLLEKRMPGLHHREKRQKQVEYFLLMTSICNYIYSHFCFLSFPGKDFHSCRGGKMLQK